MKKILQKTFFSLSLLCLMYGGLAAQCGTNLVSNGGFESGMADWWNWNDNNPDAYSFTLSADANSGDSSIVINLLTSTDQLSAFAGAEYNNRSQVIPVVGGVTYEVSFAAKGSVAGAKVNFFVKDEFAGWATLHDASFDLTTEWATYTTSFVADESRADVHIELKIGTDAVSEAHSIFLDDVVVCGDNAVTATCDNNVVANPGFEMGRTDWWDWHGGSDSAYVFGLSDDAYLGDSSVFIQVLETNPTGTGEYNSRPQMSPVVGGEFYQISMFGKSTAENTNVQIWVKDENDSWFTLFNGEVTFGTEWSEHSLVFQADMDRADIHLEIKVFNQDFAPYTVFFDEVSVCQIDITTNTCPENVVDNPGFEDGATTNWWTWHGGDETDYAFETSMDAIVGVQSAVLKVLKPTSEITGTGEFNSRPQVSPIKEGQNYRVNVWAKSTLDGAGLQVWVKDEFDGWTTIGNMDFTVGTDWTEASFIMTGDFDREDVHLEIKVFTEGATEPYEVYIDEVSICETDEEPGSEIPVPEVLVFGSATNTATCLDGLLVDDFVDTDLDGDGLGWEVWDGNDAEVVTAWVFDPILAFTGDNSIRMDVPEAHGVAELHNRFGNRFTLEAGTEYTMTVWARADVPEGDTIRVYARPIRDTDWQEPTHGNFMVTSSEWTNFSHTFTMEEEYGNAFVELKAQRWDSDFTAPYTIWYDDFQLCKTADASISTSIQSLEDLGLAFNLSPNPVITSIPAQLSINAPEKLDNAAIRVFDMLGKQIWEQTQTISTGSQTIEIPTQNMSSGMYQVNIYYNGYIKNLKLNVID